MLFNSLSFLLFFPVVCIVYFLIPMSRQRERNVFLLLASYYFYMSWQPVYALLLLTSTVITYLVGIGLVYCDIPHRRKLMVMAGITANLSMLFLFKYFNFLAQSIGEVFISCGLSLQVPHLDLLLPVCISFYTFQALGYSIDVYRGTTSAERDFPTYALFVSIERSSRLLPQFRETHHYDYDRMMKGISMMLWGYFLKLMVADRCALYVNAVYNNLEQHTGGSYLLASLLFPFQIYGDFAGYSLIAIGAAYVMGFRLMENFHRPYLSTSVGMFWHRWHISLSTWFRDYVYLPLGGSRVGRVRHYINLLITFVVSGAWHGANWTFLCWGVLHGVLLCVEKALGIDKCTYHGIAKVLHIVPTFILVSLAWVLFRANSLTEALTVFKGIFLHLEAPLFGRAEIFFSVAAIAVVVIKEVTEELSLNWHVTDSPYWLFRHLYMVLMVACLILFGVLDSTQFIYFQF